MRIGQLAGRKEYEGNVTLKKCLAKFSLCYCLQFTALNSFTIYPFWSLTYPYTQKIPS